LKYLIYVILLIVSFTSFGQEGLSSSSLEFNDFGNLSQRGFGYDSLKLQKQLGIGKSSIFGIPGEFTEDKKNSIEGLWKQLKGVCPTCSTAGTIGEGGVLLRKTPLGRPSFFQRSTLIQ
jgi:hypothetical protein